MRPDYCAAATLVASLLLTPPVTAEAPLLTLQKNPFTRPQILAVKPPPAKTQNAREAAPVKLRLSATMVSDTAPMVIADGELLAVGDSIKGLKLVEVLEGKAVFSRAGEQMIFEVDE